MDYNIPEEIQEKLKIIEKEADFSQKMKPPEKKQLYFGIIFIIFFVLGILTSTNNKNYYELAFFLLFGIMFIEGYSEYKKLYKIHSNARDIISYYRDREVKK